ncbi:hypothetical protein KSC_012980 [Ktedonobacter sp. SOSP1-52]|nr:hypothetical protein KSC_012980 [Ktedonobacter sp. SOSP1-52]
MLCGQVATYFIGQVGSIFKGIGHAIERSAGWKAGIELTQALGREGAFNALRCWVSMPVRGSASFQPEKPDEWRHNGDMKELTCPPLITTP